MPFSVQAKNVMLDALGSVAVYMSVNKTAPGSTGAGEMTGVTRQAVTWNSASGGSKTQSNSPSFSSLSTSEAVNYVTIWSSITGGTYYGYQQVTTTSVVSGGSWTYVVNPGTIDLNAVASA